MPDISNSLDDCAGLEDVSYFEEWIDFDKRFKNKYGRGFPKEISLTLESFIFIPGQEDLVDASAQS